MTRRSLHLQTCPSCDAIGSAEYAGTDPATGDDAFRCHECGTYFDPLDSDDAAGYFTPPSSRGDLFDFI